MSIVIQLLSHVPLCDPMDCSMPGLPALTISRSLLKLMSTALVIPSSHLILWCPLLPSVFPSIRDFSSELAVHIRWPEYWSFIFSISPSNKYSGLISLKIWMIWSSNAEWPWNSWPSWATSEGLSGVFSTTTLEGISSLAFCLLYGPALTTVCDHWEDHSLDYMDLCRQSNVYAFPHTV